MNYYDEILLEIEELMADKNYDRALRIIENELDLAYVPRDFEKTLRNYRQEIKAADRHPEVFSDEKVEEYLNGDETCQLIGVQQLHQKNLRDYLLLCENYLKGDGFLNAKVLLIDSLIEQEINHQFKLKKNDVLISFNPALYKPAVLSDAYLMGERALNEYYLKEPSKLLMGKQLLYKEVLLSLPERLDGEDGELIAGKIEKYIDEAFDSAE